MNIKQPKKQFTELTGLPATRQNILQAIRDNGGYHSDWLSYARDKYPNPNGEKFTDARTKDCWLSIVGYLNVLIKSQQTQREVTLQVLKDTFKSKTGIEPTKKAIITACNKLMGFYIPVNQTVIGLQHFDTRRKDFWISLLKWDNWANALCISDFSYYPTPIFYFLVQG